MINRLNAAVCRQSFLAYIAIVFASVPLPILFAKNDQTSQSEAKIDSNSSEYKSALNSHIENEIKTTLDEVLPSGSFFVLVEAKLKETASPKYAYVPNGVASQIAFRHWRSRVSKLQIDIHLANSYSKKSQKTINKILTNRFNLDEKKGDKISFQDLGIEGPRSRQDLEVELLKLDAESRDLRTKNEAMTSEIAEIKKTNTKSNSLAKDVTEDETKASKQALGPFETFLNKYSRSIFIATALALGLGLVLLSLMLRTAAKILGRALGDIGSSLAGVGEKIGEGLQNSSTLESSGNKSPYIEAPQIPNSNLNRSENQESLHILNVKMREELHSSLNDQNESIAVQLISSILESGQTSKAMALLELLGKQKSFILFQKIPSNYQMLIMDFIKQAKFERSKAELMNEAGEELKTKLIASNWSLNHFEVNHDVKQAILKIPRTYLKDIVQDLKTAHLPRFLSYFEAPQIAELLRELRNSSPQLYTSLSQAIIKIPDSSHTIEFDKDILQCIEGLMKQTENDRQQPFLNYYRNLVESSDEAIADELILDFEKQDPRVGNYLRETIINFGVFYRLRKEYREQIVDLLNNRDIAALSCILDESQLSLLKDSIESRRWQIIEDEVDRVKSRGSLHVTQQSKEAKKKVTDIIKTIRQNYSLLDIIEPQEKQEQSQQNGKSAA